MNVNHKNHDDDNDDDDDRLIADLKYQESDYTFTFHIM